MGPPLDPQYYVGYLSLTDELNWVAPAGLAAPAGAAPPVSRPVEGSFRKRPRKQTMRSAKEQEEFQERAFEKRQADLKKLEREAARVAKQQAAVTAVALQNWQQIHKAAADVRHSRQKAVAERQAARAHMAEAAQATSKAVAVKKAPVEAPGLQAEQQGPAPLPSLARAPKAAGQRGRNSGGRQKKVAVMKKPTKKVGRAQGSSTGRKRPLAAKRSTLAKQFCRCCFTTNAPTWRRGCVQPYTGQQLCNACSIWERRHGSLSGSHDKVGKYRKAYLAQQGQGSGAFGGGGAMPQVQAEQQATEGPLASQQQGSTLQHIGACYTTQPQSAAAAPAAALAPDAVQQQECSQRNRPQHVQQADIPAGDAGSGTTEAGPQAKRKRSAADSSMQQVQPKRAKAGCRGRHGAEVHEASTGGQCIMPGALDSSSAVPHQQWALRARKPMPDQQFDMYGRRHHRTIENYLQQ